MVPEGADGCPTVGVTFSSALVDVTLGQVYPDCPEITT